MFLDASIAFSTAQAITSTAASTSLYDITGAGSGNAPAMIGGNGNVIGQDIGAGDGVVIPYIYVDVSTAFVSAGGATLTVQLQCAPDNGSNSPGTYTTIFQTTALAVSQLGAASNVQFQVPPIPSGTVLPRFYRLNYVVATSTFSAGALSANMVLNPASSLLNSKYPNNFVA